MMGPFSGFLLSIVLAKDLDPPVLMIAGSAICAQAEVKPGEMKYPPFINMEVEMKQDISLGELAPVGPILHTRVVCTLR